MKHSGIPASAFPKHVQDRIAAALLGVKPGEEVTVAIPLGPLATAGKPRLRQSTKGPNKTEAAFAAHVRACYPGSLIFEQAVTLVLANGLRYTPDLFFPGANARPDLCGLGHSGDPALIGRALARASAIAVRGGPGRNPSPTPFAFIPQSFHD